MIHDPTARSKPMENIKTLIEQQKSAAILANYEESVKNNPVASDRLPPVVESAKAQPTASEPASAEVKKKTYAVGDKIVVQFGSGKKLIGGEGPGLAGINVFDGVILAIDYPASGKIFLIQDTDGVVLGRASVPADRDGVMENVDLICEVGMFIKQMSEKQKSDTRLALGFKVEDSVTVMKNFFTKFFFDCIENSRKQYAEEQAKKPKKPEVPQKTVKVIIDGKTVEAPLAA